MPTELEEVWVILPLDLNLADSIASLSSSFTMATPRSAKSVHTPPSHYLKRRGSQRSSGGELGPLLESPTGYIQGRPMHSDQRFEAAC